jgi:hypothetical protein
MPVSLSFGRRGGGDGCQGNLGLGAHSAPRPVYFEGRAPTVVAIAALAAAMLIAPAFAVAQTARLRSGYQVEYVDFAGVSIGGAVVPHPSLADTFYAVTGGFQNATLHRLDLAAPGAPVLVADGADDLVGGDDQLDSGFGSIAAIAVMASGQLVIVDNDNPLSGGSGDRVFLATDLNADGDFLDVVATVPEVSELIPTATLDALTGQADFTGAAAYVPPVGHPFAGDLFLQTSDGAGNGEVIRIADPSGAPAANVFFDGFDYGGGVTSDSGAILVGTSTFPGGGSLFRLVDNNNDDDALDGGEANALYSGTLEGCSAIALAATGDIVVAAFRQDFTGSEFLLASATIAEAATAGLHTPIDFTYSGNVAIDGAGSFSPFAGAGAQRALFPVNGALGVVSPATDPAITTTSPHYYAASHAGPSVAEPWSGAVAAIPGETTVVLAAAGVPGDERVWRFDFTDADFPSYALAADGTADLFGGDAVNDNGFGGIADLLVLPGGEVVVSDNGTPAEGGSGERLWLLVDGNSDDDYLDAGEVAELIPKATLDALTGQADFTGSRVIRGADGALFTSTGDLGDAGEVIRIADPTGTPSAMIFFTDGAQGGIDIGGALEWNGGGIVFADADADFLTPGNDRLWKLVDNNNDGDALDAGESTLISSTLDLAVAFEAGPGPAGSLWRTIGIGGSSLDWIHPGNATVVRVAATTTNTFTGLAFTSLSVSTFEPGAGNADLLVVGSTDLGLPAAAFLTVISADAVLPVELSGFALE